MFGIGMQEMLMILVVAVIFVGPTKLPQVARTIGKGMRELRRASDDLKNAVMFEADDEADSWRKPSTPAPKLSKYADQSESTAAIAGSLVATGEPSDDATEGLHHTISREDSGPVTAPDPMDAGDHSGMPYAPNSPEMNAAIASAQRALAPEGATSDANVVPPGQSDQPRPESEPLPAKATSEA